MNLSSWASLNGNLDVIRFLIESGADVTAQDNGALIEAVSGGFLDVVRLLVEKGADVTARNNYPIIEAASIGDLDILQWLADNGADMTAHNIKQAILEATEYEHVVKWFVDKWAGEAA